jgi:hypothetical protein
MPLHRAVYTSWDVDDFGDWGWTHRPHLETVQELLACSEIDVNAVTTTVCYLPFLGALASSLKCCISEWLERVALCSRPRVGRLRGSPASSKRRNEYSRQGWSGVLLD